MRRATCCALGCLAAFMSPMARATVLYNVIPIGTYDNGISEAYAINDNGVVAGFINTGSGNKPFYFDGSIHVLPTLGGTNAVATGINDSGVIVGGSNTSGTSGQHAFYYNGTMHDIGTLGGPTSAAAAINSGGVIVGGSFTGPSTSAAYYYDGSMHQFGPTSTSASDINDAGLITGSYPAGAFQDAFIYDGTTMHDLGTLGGNYSIGRSINSLGQVAGASYLSTSEQRAFLL